MVLALLPGKELRARAGSPATAIEHYLCVPQRAGAVLPLTRHPSVMRALRHPWLRLPQHPRTAVDHQYGLPVF